MAVAPTTEKADGFKTLFDTVVAPREAFEAIAIHPTWAWALLIAIVVAVAGSIINVPAYQHAFTADWPHTIAKSPQLLGESPEQQQASLAVGVKVLGFFWVAMLFIVPFAALLASVIMLLFNALGRGQGTFVQYWAASCNILIVSIVLASIAVTAIIFARGPASFDSMQALTQATPSLAMLAPPDSAKLVTFLSAFNPFSLWAAGLVVLAMRVIGKVTTVHAWLAGLAVLLVPTLVGVAFAK